MSIVTGVTLHMCCHENPSDDHADVPIMAEVNAWLAARHKEPLTSVEEHYRGGKHPQALIFGGGYSWFDEDDFAAFIMTIDWHCPASVVLILNVEEYGAKVYRPGNLGDQRQGNAGQHKVHAAAFVQAKAPCTPPIA